MTKKAKAKKETKPAKQTTAKSTAALINIGKTAVQRVLLGETAINDTRENTRLEVQKILTPLIGKATPEQMANKGDIGSAMAAEFEAGGKSGAYVGVMMSYVRRFVAGTDAELDLYGNMAKKAREANKKDGKKTGARHGKALSKAQREAKDYDEVVGLTPLVMFLTDWIEANKETAKLEPVVGLADDLKMVATRRLAEEKKAAKK